MNISFAAATVSAVAGLLILSQPVFAQQKTARACQAEWRANLAANQAAGITLKDYVIKCRAESAAAAPVPAAKQAPAATVGSAAPTAPAAPARTGANQFATEVLAKGRCGADNVVWANLGSRIYHFSGNRDYGNTKQGAYMCEKDAVAQGIRAAKNEKHP